MVCRWPVVVEVHTPSGFAVLMFWPASSRGTGVGRLPLACGCAWCRFPVVCRTSHTLCWPGTVPASESVCPRRDVHRGVPRPADPCRGGVRRLCGAVGWSGWSRSGAGVSSSWQGSRWCGSRRVELAGWLPSACGVAGAGTLACRRGGAGVGVRVRVWLRARGGGRAGCRAGACWDGVACTGRVARGRCGACASPG